MQAFILCNFFDLQDMLWEKLSHPNDSSQSTDNPMYYKDEDSFKTQSMSNSSDNQSIKIKDRVRPLRKLQPPWLDSVNLVKKLVMCILLRFY